MGTVHLTFATLLGLLLFNQVKIHPPTRPQGQGLGLQSPALAQTEGRKVGGSLNRPTPSGSTPSRSTPSSGGSNRPNRSAPVDGTPSSQDRGGPGGMPVPLPPHSYPTPQYSDRPYEEAAGTGLKPAPVSPPTYQPSRTAPAVRQPEPAAPESPQSHYLEHPTPETPVLPGQILLALLIMGGAILALAFLGLQGGMTGVSDRANERVTVIKLQIGLLVSTREIQSHLTHLSLHADFDTQAGLTALLQDSALLLLRHSEAWSHGQGISQTVDHQNKAVRLFQQYLIQERSKFKTETWSRVRGKIPCHHSPHPSPGDLASDPAAYIVVTLLLGIKADQPFLGPVYSGKELQSALQQIAALSPDELFEFELLWSPQEETERLSEDDLLTQYSELIKI